MAEIPNAALTPKDWARHRFDHGALSAERFRDLFIGRPTGNLGVRFKPDLWATETPRDCHALAALCLYGQPFGFTQEDVDELRDLARAWEADDSRLWGKNAASCRRRATHAASLADRIAALLPPPERVGS